MRDLRDSTTMTHYLYLNRAELVFFPANPHGPDGEPFVVQVIIRTARYAHLLSSQYAHQVGTPHNRSQPSSLELATFFLAQHEITVRPLIIRPSKECFLGAQQAVENVVNAHILSSLPEKIRLVGQGYVLNGGGCTGLRSVRG